MVNTVMRVMRNAMRRILENTCLRKSFMKK